MLPGISAEDCLFADLGIDPAIPGLQALEATDLLLRNRMILTDQHVVIWQVGCVGALEYKRSGYANQQLSLLIERLQKCYGHDYKIVHYIAADNPLSEAVIEHIPLRAFLEAEVAKKITTSSSFYIPPKDVKGVDPEMAVKLGLVKTRDEAKQLVVPVHEYGPTEKEAVAELAQWSMPKGYLHRPATNAARYTIKLCQDVPTLKEHRSDPEKSMKLYDLSRKDLSGTRHHKNGDTVVVVVVIGVAAKQK